MEIKYSEIENRILNDIKEQRNLLQNLYETLNEAEEFGYEVTFGANSTDESIQSAFKTGRAIGEIEGKIDQLNTFLNFFYTQEQTKEG